MNREEEIVKAAEKTSKAMWDFIDDDYTIPFKHGAQWADSHPVNQWHKAEDELPPRKSEDSHQSLVVIVSDGFDFEKAYYNYFYGAWVGNNITPLYWMRLLKPEE